MLASGKRYPEKMVARFEPGTFDAIDSVRGGREDRTEFVRVAVENEIAKRRKGAGK
jgi:hypothetical protein